MSNFTRFPNWLIDEAMPNCDPNEWRVICVIVRGTIGWGRDCVKLSIAELKKETGIGGKSTLVNAVNGVIAMGYIAREESGMGYEYRLTSPEIGLVLNQDMSQNRTSTSPEIGQEVVPFQDYLPPTLKKERKDKESTPDPTILLAAYFTELTALFPKNGSYDDEWRVPLTVLYKKEGDLESAKDKLRRAWEFARNSNGRGKAFTIKSPSSLSTIIANLPEGDSQPGTIKVRTR